MNSSNHGERVGPLSGIRVVEFAGLGPVPFCAMMLADAGADVLRIERPDHGSVRDRRFDIMLRGRRSVILDLKHPDGVQAALSLVARADILLEGFRPGVMESLGLSPETCLQKNSKLVYGRMTGWGQSGPLAGSAGHDINYIALCGVLWSIGRRGEAPVPPVNLVGDFGGGAMYLAFGVLCALLESRISGQGQVVDAAMIDGASSLTAMIHGMYAQGEWRMARGENILDTGAPWYDVYETSDKKHVAIGAFEPKFYAELLRHLELDPARLPSQYDRAGWPRLRQAFAERFKTRTQAAWCEALEGKDACFAPVLSPVESRNHPHILARGTFVEIDGIVQPAPAPRFSRSVSDIPAAPPPPGADSISALLECGLPEQQVAALIEGGIARQAYSQPDSI